MKNTLLSVLLLLLSLPLQAAEPARVLLFGTFHFQDAGLDVVKQKDVDVLTAEPGQRIIAIGGAGHMAILKQLLAIDGRLEGVGVESYF